MKEVTVLTIRSLDPDTKLFFRGRTSSHGNNNEEDYLGRRVHCDLMCVQVDGVEGTESDRESYICLKLICD